MEKNIITVDKTLHIILPSNFTSISTLSCDDSGHSTWANASFVAGKSCNSDWQSQNTISGVEDCCSAAALIWAIWGITTTVSLFDCDGGSATLVASTELKSL